MIKRVLFVGLGSAGQRHLRNLLALTENKVEVMAFRCHISERVLSPDMKVIENETLAGKYGILEFEDYEEALNEKPDAVFITNPNSMHMPYAVKAAERGYDLFIEKPLCTSMEQTEQLKELVEKNKIVCQVGYQYRYHPCVQLAKEYLDKGVLGQIVSVHAEIGERVNKMHRYEDYRNMLESHSELGGGVVLCQIHELDYLLWLFGIPERIYSVGGKQSDFELNVEDTATSILRYDKEGKQFCIVLHQDFLQYPPTRRCKVIGTKGSIEIDTLGCTFRYADFESEKSMEKRFESFDRNDMFLEELRDLLRCIETREIPESNVYTGAEDTRTALAIKESFIQKKEIRLNGKD